MDSLTHIALGAVIGETSAGKKLGKKALLWGAIFQSLPDIDFVAAFFLEPTDNLVAHRGFTHSLLFDVIVTLAVAFLLAKWSKTNQLNFRQWAIFIGIQITVHLFLDGLNNYGVGWFEPFHDARISLNVIFIADPLYSIGPGIACIVLLFLSSQHPTRMTWAVCAIIASSCYLVCCATNKFIIHQKLEKTLTSRNIHPLRQFTTPTAFNNMLWYCVTEVDEGYYIGYCSIFDKSEITFTYFPRQDKLLHGMEGEPEIQNLMQFSQGFYTIEKQADALVFNDLRFGRVAGWNNEPTEFTFHYYLQQPGKNMLVVQRGRFAELNLKTAKSLFKRIQGE